MKSLLAVPIPCKMPFRGNLYLCDKVDGTPFDANDEATLGHFAVSAAIAIDNAELHRRVGELAASDERLRLAHEMHDGLAQVLAYVNTKAQAVQGYLRNGKAAGGRQPARPVGRRRPRGLLRRPRGHRRPAPRGQSRSRLRGGARDLRREVGDRDRHRRHLRGRRGADPHPGRRAAAPAHDPGGARQRPQALPRQPRRGAPAAAVERSRAGRARRRRRLRPDHSAARRVPAFRVAHHPRKGREHRRQGRAPDRPWPGDPMDV